MSTAQACHGWLHNGRTLHLQHGPIDLLIRCEGTADAVSSAYAQAQLHFSKVLITLMSEVDVLRSPIDPRLPNCVGPVAQHMQQSCAPFAAYHVSAMASVAGAVADHILAAISAVSGITRAWVNNGGDIALFLAPGQQFDCALIASPEQPVTSAGITLYAADGIAGVATSGLGGRSFTLGIADAVTVLASNAASADVCATLIANAVDLPGHAAISRVPANSLDPDSDLGQRLVTQRVGKLSAPEIMLALHQGKKLAEHFVQQGYIDSALLHLRDRTCCTDNSARLMHASRSIPQRQLSEYNATGLCLAEVF